MSAKSIRTSDGVRLTTSSQRRLVTFVITDDSKAFVTKRTDNYETAKNNHLAARRNYLRAVTVDFRNGTDLAPRVLWDSADVTR
jgi:hypothetical protein